MGPERVRVLTVQRVDAIGVTMRGEHVVVEAPLTVRAGGPGQDPIDVMTTLRTPGSDADLAVGWLIGEGLASPEDVVAIRSASVMETREPDDVVVVQLARPLDVARVAHRHGAATASCGLCGRELIRGLLDRITPLPPDAADASPVAWDVIARLPDRLRAEQDDFGLTGGLHATGLFARDGTLLVLREDVGRHNALDAAIGALARSGPWPPFGTVALLSGRIGVELVAKAAAAGIALLVGVGAPTDLAVRSAEALGVTLIGFLRTGSGNVYAHPSRIAPAVASVGSA